MKLQPRRAVCGIALLTACGASSGTSLSLVDVPRAGTGRDGSAADRGGVDGAALDVAIDQGFDGGASKAGELDASVTDPAVDRPADGPEIDPMDGPPGEVACGDGRDLCGGACTDLQRDPSHCGACGVRCCLGLFCSTGTCQGACAAGLSSCGTDPTCRGGACRDLQTDHSHCGACGNTCGAGMRCALGACTPEALDAGRNDGSGG